MDDYKDISWIDDFPAKSFPTPATRNKTFKEAFEYCAARFMKANEIAKVLMITPADLDHRCRAAYSMPSTDAAKYFATASDAELRDVLWDLAQSGNNSAIQIYTKYLAGIADDRRAQEGNGVQIIVNVPKEDDE